MPRRAIDREHTKQELIKRLKHQGPQSRAELQKALAVSQPTVSRIIQELSDHIVAVGRTPNLLYAHKGHDTWPIFEVNRNGKITELDELNSVLPRHFLLLGQLHSDLPYFLYDMRPSGFLGRLVPPLHPELALPRDIHLWSAQTTLKYLAHAGFNAPGNLIVGEKIAQEFLLRSGDIKIIPRSKYAMSAANHLKLGEPGSSAAGEQPKFLATNKDGTHFIVKFSPPQNESVGKRLADILVCEHLAMTLLRDAGLSAAKTAILKQADRTFLEVERFDRIGAQGRQGVISLGALSAEFVGNSNSWSDAGEALFIQKKIPQEWCLQIRFFEIFGHLIANTDMHLFNFSFFSEHGSILLNPAPVYDMCPMAYAPRAHQIVPYQFAPPAPRKRDADIWEKALPLALSFWEEVSKDSRVSEEFRDFAAKNKSILSRLR